MLSCPVCFNTIISCISCKIKRHFSGGSKGGGGRMVSCMGYQAFTAYRILYHQFVCGLSYVISRSRRVDPVIIAPLNGSPPPQKKKKKKKKKKNEKRDHSLQVLTKCRITMHNNQFMLLLNDMKRKLLACFYPLQMLCNTSFFQYDQLIFLILVFILLIAFHLFGIN